MAGASHQLRMAVKRAAVATPDWRSGRTTDARSDQERFLKINVSGASKLAPDLWLTARI